jgi:amino acid transporter
MDIDQLKSNWKVRLEQPSTQDFEENMTKLKQQFATLDKKINERSLYGSIMFVLIIAALAFQTYFSYILNESMLTIVASASWIIVLVISLIRILLLKQKYKQQNNNLNIAQSLAYKLSKIESEIHFNQSLIWTILTPMIFGLILMFIDSSYSLFINLLISLVIIVGFYLSYAYNKHYVSNRLLPIRNDILANLAAASHPDEKGELK